MRILCISHWAPPAVRPQAVLLGKMLPEWRRRGMQVCLATCPTDWAKDIPKSIISIPGTSLWSKISYRHVALRKMYENLRLARVVRQLERFHAKCSFDVVFSFANPMEANFIGARLHDILGVPFVAHYSDAFVNHPFKKRSHSAYEEALSHEVEVLESASKVVFVSESLQKIVLSEHDKDYSDKAVVIPHCYNPDAYPERPIGWREKRKFVLSHVGAFYKERSPEVFLSGLDVFQKKYPELVPILRVDFIGADLSYTDYSGECLKDALARYAFNFSVRITPSIPYGESLAAMKASHALVAIDKDMEQSPFLLCKVFDYMGSGTHTLAFATEDSATANVVKKCGGKVFGFSKKHSVEFADHLAELIQRPIPKELSTFDIVQYSVSDQTETYMKLFQEVIKKSNRV